MTKHTNEKLHKRLKTISRGKKTTLHKDRRQAARRDCQKQAKISSKRGLTIAGVMMDQSATGARLIHSGDHIIPAQLYLKVGMFSKKRPARTIWRSGTEVGIEFITAD